MEIEKRVAEFRDAINYISLLHNNNLTQGSKNEIVKCFEANLEQVSEESRKEFIKDLKEIQKIDNETWEWDGGIEIFTKLFKKYKDIN